MRTLEMEGRWREDGGKMEGRWREDGISGGKTAVRCSGGLYLVSYSG
jgi:hypothetical protein